MTVVMGLNGVWVTVSGTKKAGLASQMGWLWLSFPEDPSDPKVGKS